MGHFYLFENDRPSGGCNRCTAIPMFLCPPALPHPHFFHVVFRCNVSAALTLTTVSILSQSLIFRKGLHRCTPEACIKNKKAIGFLSVLMRGHLYALPEAVEMIVAVAAKQQTWCRFQSPWKPSRGASRCAEDASSVVRPVW